MGGGCRHSSVVVYEGVYVEGFMFVGLWAYMCVRDWRGCWARVAEAVVRRRQRKWTERAQTRPPHNAPFSWAAQPSASSALCPFNAALFWPSLFSTHSMYWAANKIANVSLGTGVCLFGFQWKQGLELTNCIQCCTQGYLWDGWVEGGSRHCQAHCPACPGQFGETLHETYLNLDTMCLNLCSCKHDKE